MFDDLILQSTTSSVNIKRCASVGDQLGVPNVLHHGDVDKFSCVGLSTGCVMSEHRALAEKILHWLNQKRKPNVALLEQARALAVHLQAVGFHPS